MVRCSVCYFCPTQHLFYGINKWKRQRSNNQSYTEPSVLSVVLKMLLCFTNLQDSTLLPVKVFFFFFPTLFHDVMLFLIYLERWCSDLFI